MKDWMIIATTVSLVLQSTTSRIAIEMGRLAFIFLCLFGYLFLGTYGINEELLAKLEVTASATKKSIDGIYSEWQIDKYPNFLKSCFMNKLSWELMKLKFQKKILSALAKPAEKTKFVISFTGSSVTAGHDSYFNASTPVVAGDYLAPAFSAIGIDLDSRNVALGNNPCTPYDVCVKYFGGLDADIVHWEQTYFCDGRPIIEQFIRQAHSMPSKPLVIFSDSNTGKWEATDCDKKKITERVLDKNEKELLKATSAHLVSDVNKDELQKRWSWLAEYIHHYHSAGIQAFSHATHEMYACEGPYIRTWMEGAASWHPSVIGHKMRAAHHAYFWLLNWAEAVAELKSLLSHRVLDAVEKDVTHRLDKLLTPMGPARHKSDFPDEAQCYTDYEPRPVREASLKARVLSGLAADDKDNKDGAAKAVGWKHMIYEDIVDHNLVLRSLKMEYRDFKYLLHGDKDAGPLSIALDLTKDSPVFLCETPGIWGSLPKGYDHLWLGVLEAYITHDVADRTAFGFKKESAMKLEFHYDKEHEICTMVQPVGSKNHLVKKGNHVLTVIGTSSTKAIIAWIITA